MTNDLDPVQQLLRCKRYEQPPPGYFDRFSDRVLARIEADQSAQASLWSWIMEKLEAKPILASAGTMFVASLLLVGMKISQVVETELASYPASEQTWASEKASSDARFQLLPIESAVAISQPTAGHSSLRPVVQAGPANSLFRNSNYRFQAIGYQIGY